MLKITEATVRLEEICGLEGTELGEYWSLLVNLWYCRDCASSKEFVDSMEKEIISEAERSLKDFEIEEQVEKVPRVFRTLKYKGEF